MDLKKNKWVIERLFAQQGDRLRGFIAARVRQQPDIADLVQEVYLRMLRVQDFESVRNPEAYLFTVAANLLKENAVRQRIARQSVDVDEASTQEQVAEAPDFVADIDRQARLNRLREVLRELPPKCHAAVVMAYWYGMTYEAIAARLDISPHMVKKYLSQALVKCRLRMGRLG
jgi:RNA polymerase sigma-70 factor (ECF subfamily)